MKKIKLHTLFFTIIAIVAIGSYSYFIQSYSKTKFYVNYKDDPRWIAPPFEVKTHPMPNLKEVLDPIRIQMASKSTWYPPPDSARNPSALPNAPLGEKILFKSELIIPKEIKKTPPIPNGMKPPM